MAAESSTTATSGRSGGGGASADSYIGSLISLTSKSEIRYEGILYNINTEESSIGLRSVRSFGTEGRKKDGPQVPPSDKIYEYILFRGSDIKDLQVKASPPVQTTPSINNDPAIIQSHYPRPLAPSTSLPGAPSGSLPDPISHSSQMGRPSSTFQNSLHPYHSGGNLNYWATSPPNVNNSGLAMPMCWQGFYGTGTPNALPQLPQQPLLRPPPSLSTPPPMQQMQFSGFNSSFSTASTSFPTSTPPDDHPSLVPNSSSSSGLTSTSSINPDLPPNIPPLQPVSCVSETLFSPVTSKTPVSAITTSTQSSCLPSLTQLPTSVRDNAGLPSVARKPIPVPGSTALPTIPQSGTSFSGESGSVLTEMQTPSLITPGQILHSVPSSAVSAPQSLQTVQKDVEVVEVTSKPPPEPSVQVAPEARSPMLPLPSNTRAQKPNGGAYHMHNNYRGRGGRGPGISRPVARFTEDFDFMAMNEKFKKDEVWGHLGQSNKSESKDKKENVIEEDYSQGEDDAKLLKVDTKPVYSKDDFFDSLSCNSLDNDPVCGRTRYSDQMKLDTETFGDFSRYRGGRGGRGPGRGGGRFRGSYHGRGYGGYGYVGRGRGRGMQGRPF